MKSFSKILFNCLCFIFLCLLLGCTKNVPGPKGDQGPAGGRGNLKLSSSVNSPTIWTPIQKGWKSYFSVPEITDSTLSRGQVDVYMKVNGQWWRLPYAVGNVIMQVKVEKGYLHFNYARIHDEGPPQPGTVIFRVVISEPVS